MPDHCPELQRNDIFLLLLCSIVTLHVPYWAIPTLLYILSVILLFLVSANCSFVMLGNIFYIHEMA